MIDEQLLRLEESANNAQRCRQEYQEARKALVVAVFTGRELADGNIWRRVCRDCRSVQPDTNAVNAACACGSRVILWEPRA